MGLSNIVHVSGRRRSSVGTDWRESSGSALTKGMSDKSLLGKTKAAKAKIMKTTSSVIATLKKPLVKSEEPAPASSPNPKPPPTTGPLIPPVNDASLVTAAPESLIDNDLEPSRLKSVTHVTKTTQGTVLIPVHQTSVPTSHFSLDEQLFLPPDPPAFFYAHWIMTKPKLMFCNPTVFCTIKNQCIQFSKINPMRLICFSLDIGSAHLCTAHVPDALPPRLQHLAIQLRRSASQDHRQHGILARPRVDREEES